MQGVTLEERESTAASMSAVASEAVAANGWSGGGGAGGGRGGAEAWVAVAVATRGGGETPPPASIGATEALGSEAPAAPAPGAPQAAERMPRGTMSTHTRAGWRSVTPTFRNMWGLSAPKEAAQVALLPGDCPLEVAKRAL